MMLEILASVVSSMLEVAPALIFATLGATLSERAGVINVGVEGMMRAGAFAAAATSIVVPTPLGVVGGMAAGTLLALVHAWLCIVQRSNQVVVGMSLNLLMVALTSFLLETVFSSPSNTPPIVQLPRWLGFSPLTWLAMGAPWMIHWIIAQTPFGLHLRAAGEKPQALAVMGVHVIRLRTISVCLGGALCGLGGAVLSAATLDRFEHHMPSGLGFMAVAAMVFGRWTPLGATAAAVFFSFGNALRISLASSIPDLFQLVPQGWLLALPYVLTIALLAMRGQRSAAPAALGVPYDPEVR